MVQSVCLAHSPCSTEAESSTSRELSSRGSWATHACKFTSTQKNSKVDQTSFVISDKAVSHASCTVLIPSFCRWDPEKSFPLYSTNNRYRLRADLSSADMRENLWVCRTFSVTVSGWLRLRIVTATVLIPARLRNRCTTTSESRSSLYNEAEEILYHSSASRRAAGCLSHSTAGPCNHAVDSDRVRSYRWQHPTATFPHSNGCLAPCSTLDTPEHTTRPHVNISWSLRVMHFGRCRSSTQGKLWHPVSAVVCNRICGSSVTLNGLRQAQSGLHD